MSWASVVWEDLQCLEDCESACSIEWQSDSIWGALLGLWPQNGSLLHHEHITTLLPTVCVSIHHQTPSISLPASNTIQPVSPLSFQILFTFICLVSGVGGVDMHVKVSLWRSEDGLGELVLSFHFVGSRDGAQVIRFGSQCIYLMSHLADVRWIFDLGMILIILLWNKTIPSSVSYFCFFPVSPLMWSSAAASVGGHPFLVFIFSFLTLLVVATAHAFPYWFFLIPRHFCMVLPLFRPWQQ